MNESFWLFLWAAKWFLVLSFGQRALSPGYSDSMAPGSPLRTWEPEDFKTTPTFNSSSNFTVAMALQTNNFLWDTLYVLKPGRVVESSITECWIWLDISYTQFMTLPRTKCAVIGSKLKLELSALIITVQLKICYHYLALNLVSKNSSRLAANTDLI